MICELRLLDTMLGDLWRNQLKLAESKELDLVLKSIEEASKHARNLLFILVISSIFVLITAYSGGVKAELLLPVLAVRVKPSEFFVISPVVILCIYAYMHIYVNELKYRISIYDGMNIKLSSSADSRVLLFPWLLTFNSSFPLKLKNLKKDGLIKRANLPSLYVYLVSSFLVVLLGPTILFAMWVKFVGNEDPVSIIPCICLIVSCFLSLPNINLSKWINVAVTVLSFMFLAITILSVPDFRRFVAFEEFWAIIKGGAPLLKDIARDFFMAVLYTTGLLAVLGKALDELLLERHKMVIADWLIDKWINISDRKRNIIIAFFIERAVDSGRPLQYLLILLGIPVVVLVGMIKMLL